MLKNAISLNRIANMFYVVLKQAKKYNENFLSTSDEEKIKQLKKIQKLIDITIMVLDRKIKLMGISKEFVIEAKKIKNQQIKDKRNWLDYLNIGSWFKE
jgi:hypothetical protein